MRKLLNNKGNPEATEKITKYGLVFFFFNSKEKRILLGIKHNKQNQETNHILK